MSFVPASAKPDLWAVLGLLVAGSVALAWSAFRGNSGAPPEDPSEPTDVTPRPRSTDVDHEPGTPQPRLL